MALQVYSEARGLKTLRDGVTLERYQASYPDAIIANVKGKQPTYATLERWMMDGVARAIDGCSGIEPDGTCSHDQPSWLVALSLI